MPVGRAHGPVARGRGAVAVLDPGRRLFRGRAPPFDVHRDRRLRSHPSAEGNELVGADVAGLGLVLPGEVGPDGAAVAGTDAPRPVVVLRDVAAGPAEERGPQRRHERLDVGPDSAHGIPGKEGRLVDPDTATALEEDGESSERIRPFRPEHEPVLGPISRDPADLRFGVRRTAGPVFLQAPRRCAPQSRSSSTTNSPGRRSPLAPGSAADRTRGARRCHRSNRREARAGPVSRQRSRASRDRRRRRPSRSSGRSRRCGRRGSAPSGARGRCCSPPPRTLGCAGARRTTRP